MLNELCVLAEINKTFLDADDGTQHVNFKKMHKVYMFVLCAVFMLQIYSHSLLSLYPMFYNIQESYTSLNTIEMYVPKCIHHCTLCNYIIVDTEVISMGKNTG